MADLKIYTRKGDDGSTGLWYGGRIPKSHGRTECYGSIDEACSMLGIARALCDDSALATYILQLQNELFVAGAQLATAPEAAERLQDGVSRVTEAMVEDLESKIDQYMGQVTLPPKFVIPGGTQLSATLDTARTIVRRAERRAVDLKINGEFDDPTLLRYLNRLSDLLFALARFTDVPEPEVFEGRG